MLVRRAVLAAAVVVVTSSAVFGMAPAAQAMPPGSPTLNGLYVTKAECVAAGQAGIADQEWGGYTCRMYPEYDPYWPLWVYP